MLDCHERFRNSLLFIIRIVYLPSYGSNMIPVWQLIYSHVAVEYFFWRVARVSGWILAIIRLVSMFDFCVSTTFISIVWDCHLYLAASFFSKTAGIFPRLTGLLLRFGWFRHICILSGFHRWANQAMKCIFQRYWRTSILLYGVFLISVFSCSEKYLFNFISWGIYQEKAPLLKIR